MPSATLCIALAATLRKIRFQRRKRDIKKLEQFRSKVYYVQQINVYATAAVRKFQRKLKKGAKETQRGPRRPKRVKGTQGGPRGPKVAKGTQGGPRRPKEGQGGPRGSRGPKEGQGDPRRAKGT